MAGASLRTANLEDGSGLIAYLRRSFRLASFMFNLVLTIAFALASWRLLGQAQAWIANAGGFPHPTIEYAMLVVNAPGLKERIIWWSMAWAAYVFAAGCALLSLAGIRSLLWRLHGALRALT